MRLIVQHEGDGRSDGFQTREWAVERHGERMEEWWGRSDLPMSLMTGVQRIARDKLDQLDVTFEGGDRIKLPNVLVIEMGPE